MQPIGLTSILVWKPICKLAAVVNSRKKETMGATHKTKVSVCIPTYNSELYLADAIDSVLAQTFQDFELIIGDDLSTDGTMEICRRYAEKDARVHVSSGPEHVGLFRNYNRCMERASGEYIKLFAHDDLLEPDALAQMVAVLDEDTEVSIVGCKRRLIDAKGNEIGSATAIKRAGKFKGGPSIRKALTKMDNSIGDPAGMMFRSEFVKSEDGQVTNGFDPDFVYLNIEFWCRLFMRGCYHHIDTVLCSQRQHPRQQGNALHNSLLYIADYQLLIEKCRYMLDTAGLDEQEWLPLVNKVMLDQVTHCLAEESLLKENCCDAAKTLAADLDAESIVHAVKRYASLNHWSMTRLTEALNTVNRLRSEKQTLTEQIAALQQANADLQRQLHPAPSQPPARPHVRFYRQVTGILHRFR